MTKLLVVSDNHSNMKVLDKMISKETFDISIHLGDSISTEEKIKGLFDYYVCGNNDLNWSIEEKEIEVEGLKIGMVHGHTANISVFATEEVAYKFAASKKWDVILFGHTHMFIHRYIKNISLINPGAANLSRGPEGNGYAIVTIDKGQIKSVDFKSC